MRRNQEPHRRSSPIDTPTRRRDLFARLLVLPAAFGLAFVAPNLAETRKKRRRKRRKRRGTNPGNDGVNDGGGDSASGDQENLFLDLINGYRQSKDRGRLSRHTQLDAAAERHSQDQAANGFSGHRGSDGSTPDERIEDAGYDWRAWGENVYWNSHDGSAQAAFTWWKNSPGHNATMLDRTFTEIGIGRARSSSGWWYWSTTFGDR